MTRSTTLFGLAISGLLMSQSGCIVPQPPGRGRETVVTEPRTKGQYYLYLPEAYVQNNGHHPLYPNRRWPVVFTFHGMKPYDTWDRQIHEWEQEADTYGYIVVAPWLQSCDSFMEYPLRREHGYVTADKERVVAILDHVMATTNADPKAVLSTSWSCGGYLAHYFPNRFPNRFTCIATRLSNFCPDLLTESNVPLYTNTPVAIFIGDGDFPACKSESEQAVTWYSAHGFKTVIGKTIDNVGHKRLPQTAAAFFAEQLGIQPIHADRAAYTLSQVTMTDYRPSPAKLAAATPRGAAPAGVQLAQAGGNRPQPGLVKVINPGKPAPTPVAPAPKAIVAQAPPRTNPAPQTSAPKPAIVQSTPPRAPQQARPVQVASTAPPAPRSTYNSLFAVQQPKPAGPGQSPPTNPQPSAPVRTSSGAVVTQRPAAPNPAPVTSLRPGNPTPDARLAAISPPKPVFDRYRPRDAGPANYPTPQPPAISGTARTAAPPREPTPRPIATNGMATNGIASGAPANSRIRSPRLVNIVLNSPAAGPAPHYISFAAELPTDLARDADFLWMDNGMWICDEPKGVKILDTPGKHRISVLVVTRDGQEFRGMREITVTPRGADARGTVKTSMR